MGQATSVISALKTGVLLLDFLILIFFLFMFYNVNTSYMKKIYMQWTNGQKNSIVICSEMKTRSIKFRAIMHYLAKTNETIFRLREDAEFDWDDIEKRSGYMVDQNKEFKITDQIYGKIRNEDKEKLKNGDKPVTVEYNTLTVFSNQIALIELQKWVDEKVKEYKDYLKQSSNEKQLFITVKTPTGTVKDRKKEGRNGNEMIVDSAEWESSITFQNSYFQNMEEIMKKIDFFLKNKEWYLQKGIPYNLGILLHGEPGCGKTRFIKQLMNYTGRHGIDVKLNDGMDFSDLQHIIFKEELNDTHIIPQAQRILIFEDIDALGEVVKDRDLKNTAAAATTNNNNNTATESDDSSSEFKMISSFLKMSSSSSSTSSTTTKNNNLSYLLNMLDGIHECSGRILIMTTNKLEVLDKALIRPGRIDIKINFKKCSCYDIKRMIATFWQVDVAEKTLKPELNEKYTCAEVLNIFRSTDDFEHIREMFCL
jgi:ATP-dependent 26S proteasome regulatory subunit